MNYLPTAFAQLAFAYKLYNYGLEGKIDREASHAMAWVEPTVALPLVVTAAVQEKLHEGRSRLKFTWEGQMLKGIEKESPVAAD